MKRRWAVALGILAAVWAMPVFAATVSYLESPSRPEEKEVAQAFERVFLAYADKNLGRITEYFAEGMIFYPNRPQTLSSGSPPRMFRGRRDVGITLTQGTSRNHRVTVRSIQVDGREAIVTARHTFDVGERTLTYREETRKWKFRKEGETWLVFELDAR